MSGAATPGLVERLEQASISLTAAARVLDTAAQEARRTAARLEAAEVASLISAS